jgi:hypothetical protein
MNPQFSCTNVGTSNIVANTRLLYLQIRILPELRRKRWLYKTTKHLRSSRRVKQYQVSLHKTVRMLSTAPTSMSPMVLADH